MASRGQDDGQRGDGSDLEPVGDQHFGGGEEEDRGQAEVQETQTLEHAGEQKEERAQTHDGQDIRCVGDEGVASDRKDGGDGVEGKDDVGDFDGDEREEKHGDHGGAALADEEDVGAVRNGVDAGHPADPDGLSGRFLFGIVACGQDEADGGGQKDEAEDVIDPVKAGEEPDAAGDEGAAHEDGSGDAPEEDAGLVGGGDFEDAEEEQEDEEIVDGEGLLERVAGKELGGGGDAEKAPEVVGGNGRGGHPHDGGGDGVAVLAGGAFGAGSRGQAPARKEELEGKQDQQDEVERDPVAEGRGGHAD